jgi:hypothetical protein
MPFHARSIFVVTMLVGGLGAMGLATPACSADITIPELKFTAGATCTVQASDAGATDGGPAAAAPSDQCGVGLLCFNSYCVGQGALRVSMAFSVDSDFDLHVLTPGGDEIYYSQREGGGGKLDVDQCISSCSGSAHVENVVFQNTPAPGTYTAWVVNYDPRAAGDFTIDIQSGDAKKRFTGSVAAQKKVESERFTFVVPLPAPPPPPPQDSGVTDAAPE